MKLTLRAFQRYHITFPQVQQFQKLCKVEWRCEFLKFDDQNGFNFLRHLFQMPIEIHLLKTTGDRIVYRVHHTITIKYRA